MQLVLTIIALQQGLFALGWWMAGWFLGLSRRAASHWGAATLGSALALCLILQRGHWHDFFTIALANVLAMAAFLLIRRGVQVFLRLPTTDRESFVLMAAVLVALAYFTVDRQHGQLAVLATSSLIAWTLLRCAWEAHRALRALGDPNGARVAAFPLALLGLVYAARVVAGLLKPEVAAQPIDQADGFNAVVVVLFMVMGLVLNMVLGYLVANRLVRRLHHRAVRDPLTGLYNRRGLTPQLAREASRMRRLNKSYAVLAVDVDHFKAVNDQHGHPTGDAVLSQLARLLHGAAREIDTVARLGGEEFCLLLPDSDAAGAQQAAERLCRLVRETPWPQLGAPLTISVGVAVARPADLSSHAVLVRADAALLQAKQAGRDRVVMADAA